jgi:hypothetical protein
MLRKTTNLIIVGIIWVAGINLQAQLKSQLPQDISVSDAIQIPGVGAVSSALGFIDPNRFFMHQSYSLSYSSWGGGSASMGVYQNTMSYIFSEKLAMNARLGFVHNPLNIGSFTTQSNLTDNLIYGADLIYRPKENTLFTISFDKTPYYYRSRFYPYGYYYQY